MTDNRPLNSEPTADSPDVVANSASPTTSTIVADSNRHERRRLIRAAVASVPVVLTFTAGKARAQDASVKDSADNSSPPENMEVDGGEDSSLEVDSSDSGELTPAEKLETFGLQRADRPEGYSEDPFRDLDTVSEPVDLTE